MFQPAFDEISAANKTFIGKAAILRGLLEGLLVCCLTGPGAAFGQLLELG